MDTNPITLHCSLARAGNKNPGASVRAIPETLAKTQVADIFKAQGVQSRALKFSDVNEALYEWYTMACSKNIFPNGPILTAKAKEKTAHLSKPEFEGSSGWLSRWKQRYNVKRITIRGESGDVRGDTVTSWKERLPETLQGYAKEDIYNLDETGCFWRALPIRGFGEKGKKCEGGKKSKQRFTIAFLVNAAGEKKAQIVIWKSERPRSFKGINSFPVKYYHQEKA